MNLVEHVKYECDLMEDRNEEPAKTMYDNIIKYAEMFAEEGHSGYSAEWALDFMHKVLSYKNFLPLTDNPAEWTLVSDGMWQSTRSSDCFSNDAGQTHWSVNDISKRVSSRSVQRRLQIMKDAEEKNDD